MKRFQILCVTMNQTDFSKLQEMNIRSDVIFSNQADRTAFEQIEFEGHIARMITTDTRGVGINRNIGLMYADAEICLFADDDVVYDDDVQERILKEFDEHPDADIMIFHLDTDHARKQIKYARTRKCGPFERMPWGGCRVAFRLSAARKANIWFTTLFGGGCVFPSGEDSIWLNDAKKAGLTFYVSKETIGKVSFEESTWFSGFDEKYFYGKGAMCQAVHAKTFDIWIVYYALRIRSNCTMSFGEKIRWMKHGKIGYQRMMSYAEYTKIMTERV